MCTRTSQELVEQVYEGQGEGWYQGPEDSHLLFCLVVLTIKLDR